MAGVGARNELSCEWVRKRKVLKAEWISSSSVTSEDFVCTQVRPVFPPCPLNALRRASFQADRHEPKHLALSRRKDAVLLISSHQQTEAQSADPQIQKKKALFVCWKLLGRLKSPQVLMLLSLSALLDSTGLAEVIYGEGIRL